MVRMAEADSSNSSFVEEELDEVKLTEEELLHAGLLASIDHVDQKLKALPVFDLHQFHFNFGSGTSSSGSDSSSNSNTSSPDRPTGASQLTGKHFSLKSTSLSCLTAQPAWKWNYMPDSVYGALKVKSYIVKPMFFLSATTRTTITPLHHHRSLDMDHIFTAISEKNGLDQFPTWKEIASQLDTLFLPAFEGLKDLTDKLQHIKTTSGRADALMLVERFISHAERQRHLNQTNDLCCHVFRGLTNFASDLEGAINEQSITENFSRKYVVLLFQLFWLCTNLKVSCRETDELPLSLPISKAPKKKMKIIPDILFETKGTAFLVGEVKRLFALIPSDDSHEEGDTSRKGVYKDTRPAQTTNTAHESGTSKTENDVKQNEILTTLPGEASENEAYAKSTPETEIGKSTQGSENIESEEHYTSPPRKSYFRSLSREETVKINIYLPQLIAELLACMEYNDKHSGNNIRYRHENIQLGFAVEGFKLRFVRLALRDATETCKPSVRELGHNNVRSDIFLTKEFNLFNRRHLRMFYQLLYAIVHTYYY